MESPKAAPSAVCAIASPSVFLRSELLGALTAQLFDRLLRGTKQAAFTIASNFEGILEARSETALGTHRRAVM